jgi:peroxiredoxin
MSTRRCSDPASSCCPPQSTAWDRTPVGRKESHFQFALIADTKGELATKYGSQGVGRPTFKRTVFVIGKDGKIAYADTRFNALAQDGYDKLAAAIKTARGN